MFYNNISYMVGSANAKLANDMKKINKINPSRLDKVTSRLNSYFCRQSNEDSSLSSMDLDFQLVKISCKKEFSHDEKSTKPSSFLEKLIHFIKFKWIFRFFAFIIVGSLVGYSIFRIIQLNTKYFKSKSENVIMNSKRNIIDYDFMNDWSGASIPTIYELEPFTFFDSNGDSYGDLKGATLKLDYIKNTLKINCVLLKNLQSNLPNLFGKFFELDNIDQKLGSILDLKNFINIANEKSIKVILELDLTGTYFGHKLFKYNNTNLYLTRKKLDSKEENRTWSFNKETDLYYYSGDRENFAYFDFDNEMSQVKFIEILKFWGANYKPNGVYLKNFNNAYYKNITSFTKFISNIRELSYSMFIAIIGDNTEKDNLKSSLYDIARINLNSFDIYTSFKRNVSHNPFEVFLNKHKKCIWSLDNMDDLPYHTGSRRNLIIGFFTIVYALPGMVLLKQGDELEYERKSPEYLKIYRWNDLENHSGFSVNFTDNLSWLRIIDNNNSEINYANTTKFSKITTSQSILHEFGFDVKFAQSDFNSLYNFIILLNTRIKPKIIDIRPDNVFTTTMFPIIPKAPEPFRNSFSSISGSYLSIDYYDLKVKNSVFKLTRQINNYQSKRKDYMSYAIRFYRNIMFLFNFSEFNLLLDELIKVSSENENHPHLTQSTIHVIYDSTKLMPEYIKLGLPINQAFYYVKPSSYLILEF